MIFYLILLRNTFWTKVEEFLKTCQFWGFKNSFFSVLKMFEKFWWKKMKKVFDQFCFDLKFLVHLELFTYSKSSKNLDKITLNSRDSFRENALLSKKENFT